jgi:hypothetical protein
MAIAGEAEHKIIIMKNRVVRALYFVFFAAAVLLLCYKIYLHSNHRSEEEETIQWIALGFLVAASICRLIEKLFPKWFHNKRGSEEIEQRVHGE